MRSARRWAPGTRHRERPSCRSRRAGGAVRVHPQRPAGDDLFPLPLVGPGAAPRLPLRPPALRRASRRHAGLDQERARQPALPAPRHGQSSGWPEPARLRPRRRHPHRPAGRLRRCPRHAILLGARPNYIRTFTAEATVIDSSAARGRGRPGQAFTQGEWVSGTQTFDYDASDNAGIRARSALSAVGPRRHRTRDCDYSQRVPCPSGRSRFAIDTAEADEGSQPLTVVAEDAAGNRAESGAVTVRIDNARARRSRRSGSAAARPGATTTTSTSPGPIPPKVTGLRSPPRITASVARAATSA